jgi:hypothetical protein
MTALINSFGSAVLVILSKSLIQAPNLRVIHFAGAIFEGGNYINPSQT